MKTNNTTKLPYEGITASVATFEPTRIFCSSPVTIECIRINESDVMKTL